MKAKTQAGGWNHSRASMRSVPFAQSLCSRLETGAGAKSHRSVLAAHFYLLAIASLSMSACSTGSLFDSDTPVSTSYVLAAAPGSENAGTSPRIPVDVSIGRPDLAAGLDTDRIAVLEGRQLDYYRRVRWGTRASELIQNLLVDSLEDQSLFRSVTAERTRVAGDYLLDVQVRDFQAEHTQGDRVPLVHVAMVGRLVRVIDRELVATVSADAQVTADDNRMSAVAAAFEAASQQAILDIARQTAAAVETDRASLSSAESRM